MERKTNSLNEKLKLLEQQREKTEHDSEMKLDDTERVKVLSPGRLVAKRFFRNKLALVGLGILIFMFVFSFFGPLFYPYSQTQIFYTFKPLMIDYASATERTEPVSYLVNPDNKVPSNVKNLLNSNIDKMEEEGLTEYIYSGRDGNPYAVNKLGDKVYTLSELESTDVAQRLNRTVVAKYNMVSKEMVYTGENLGENFEKAAAEKVKKKSGTFEADGKTYSFEMGTKKQYSIMSDGVSYTYTAGEPAPGFEQAAEANLEKESFRFGGENYITVKNADGSYTFRRTGAPVTAYVASTLAFNSPEAGTVFSDEFKIQALLALYTAPSFVAGGRTYLVSHGDGNANIITDEFGNVVADASSFVVRRYSGQDTLSLEFKEAVQQVISRMAQEGKMKDTFTFPLPEIDADGNNVLDENGNTVDIDTQIYVNRKNNGEYVINCEQVTYLIDIYATPTKEHWLGTDGDGMDILARMMYGGRISLMVGFVVVLMETVLGVLLGGIAGFFGGWVDTLVMRLVDIFYCVPTYPILIIMGAFMDSIKLDPYKRLLWMMVILGVLGWASVARLVRGQILSLREQEFMIAQEATGMRASRRILRHLVPNVMPYLIVNATMGLGSVIITESTLSFLGLGVKHPLATWGTMINSVASTTESMIKYTYIWIPVGLLICLTVIAFNFVGDGLRDAFDPKSK